MKEFWNFIQMVFMAVGGWLGWFMGGCDGLLYALVAFVVIDYLTGVMCAFADHTLSSEVGFRGICRKVLIFLLVGMANILDVAVIGNGSVLRTAVIFFYISNEGVSLLENAGHLGLPIPQKVKEVLENSCMTEVKRGMGNELVKSSNKKSVETVAKEVIAGKWGKGGDRKKRLQAAGYDYGAVQRKVNELMR